MIISKIGLTLTEDDINTGLTAAFEKMKEAHGDAMKKIKNPRVVLKNGIVHFKCSASMGFLPVPIDAQIRLAPTMEGTALNITLSKVSMAMMGGAAAASALMGQLATAVAGKPGLSVNGDTLTVELKTFANMRKITLGGTLNDIAVVDGTLALDFS